MRINAVLALNCSDPQAVTAAEGHARGAIAFVNLEPARGGGDDGAVDVLIQVDFWISALTDCKLRCQYMKSDKRVVESRPAWRKL